MEELVDKRLVRKILKSLGWNQVKWARRYNHTHRKYDSDISEYGYTWEKGSGKGRNYLSMAHTHHNSDEVLRNVFELRAALRESGIRNFSIDSYGVSFLPFIPDTPDPKKIIGKIAAKLFHQDPTKN